MVERSSLDAALARVGGWKRWHIAMYALVSMSFNMPLSWQGMNIIFEGWEPPHTCIGSDSSPHRRTNDDPRNSSLPLSDLENRNVSNPDSRCYLQILDAATGEVKLEKCNAWSYNNDGYFTIVEQWDLVCDRNYYPEMSQSLYQLGSIIGKTACFVVDIYGRKKIHAFTHLIIAIVGLFNACPVSYFAFVITRTLLGIFVAVNITSGAILVLEFFDSGRRTLTGIMEQSVWMLASVTLCGLAYVITKWNHLQMILSLASAVLGLIIMLIPESPSWLVSKDRMEEADKILRNIAKWNNIKLDPDETLIPKSANDLNNPQSEASVLTMASTTTHREPPVRHVPAAKEEQKRENTLYKLKDPIIMELVAITSFNWFGVSLVFYGVMFLAPALAGNRFMNFFILALVELPATVMAYFLSKTVGRRLTSSLSSLGAGCLLAVASFVPQGLGFFEWLYLVLILFSKLFLTVTLAVMVLYTQEYIPTEIRATCCGISLVWARIGSLLAPMVILLVKANLKWLPIVIFALTCLSISFLILFLPETKNQPLPQNIIECRILCDQTSFWKYFDDSTRKPRRAKGEHYLDYL